MEDDTPPADSLLPYDEWMEESLRHVIVRAVRHAATVGLPGKHHFYITFRTDYPGVTIPARLREKYPQEMTIVLQHQFRDLTADEATRAGSASRCPSAAFRPPCPCRWRRSAPSWTRPSSTGCASTCACPNQPWQPQRLRRPRTRPRPSRIPRPRSSPWTRFVNARTEGPSFRQAPPR